MTEILITNPLTFTENNAMNPPKNERGILAMLRPKSIWVSWRAKKKRWEVGLWWKGKLELFYQFQGIPHISKEIAEEHAAEIRTEIRKKPPIFDPTKHKKRGRSRRIFSEHTKLWFREYQIKVDQGKRSADYVDALKRYNRNYWCPQLGDLDMAEVNEIVIKEIYLLLCEKKCTQKYIENVMAPLHKLFKDAHHDNIISTIPRFPDYKAEKSNKEPRWIMEDEQDLVIAETPSMHRQIVTTILYHGLRPSEARCLKWENVNLKTQTLYIPTLKRGKPRALSMEPVVYEAIKSMPRAVHHDYVFHHNGRPYAKTTLWKVFRKALDDAGFPDVQPKDASRHSHASQLLRRGANTREVQYIMGHADIRTTEIYTHVLVEDQKKYRRGLHMVNGYENEASKENQ